MSRQRDPIVAADRHWKEHGWDTGWRFRAALSVSRVAELIRQHDEAVMRPVRLTSSKHEALAVVYFSRHGELSLGRLGQRLLVHPTSVTSTVDTLERLGYVERVPHPTDRRTTLARITDHGRRAVEGSNDGMTETRYGLAALSSAQARSVFNVLTKVRLAR